MSKPKRIFIIGHMGAGKALFSKALAKKLGWEYIDANPSLERYIGRHLNEIIGDEGAAAFHACEAEIINHYKSKEHVIVLLEEGVVASEKNRALLSSEYVIYLKVDTAMQLDRMKGGRIPLLPIADMKVFLDQQHAMRDKYYEDVATLIIDSDSVEKDVDKIMSAITPL